MAGGDLRGWIIEDRGLFGIWGFDLTLSRAIWGFGVGVGYLGLFPPHPGMLLTRGGGTKPVIIIIKKIRARFYQFY